MSAAVSTKTERLDREDRRDALLDAAALIVAEQGADAVSMDVVAEQVGVSRPLVYKHFANRAELLEALYAREADALHLAIATQVEGARTLEEMFRALVRGSLQAQAERGATFAALRAAGGRTDARRSEQRQRDGATLRYFVSEAMREFGLAKADARAAVAIALSSIDGVINVFRARPTPEYAALLEDTYVSLVMNGLKGLAT